jgi:hypothetical protein
MERSVPEKLELAAHLEKLIQGDLIIIICSFMSENVDVLLKL